MKCRDRLRRRLQRGETLLGTWSVLPSPAVTNVLGAAGLDYAIIDLEHGPANLETVENMVRAAECEGSGALVRVPVNEESWVLRVLETGAHGVVVPQVSSVEEARRAVAAVKYYPEGRRGMSPYTRSGGYHPGDGRQWTADANRRTVCVLIVEGEEGLANLDQICAVPGVDVVYLGIYDISQSLGHPGDVHHPDVVRAIESCIGLLNKRGVAGGCLVQNRDDVRRALELGFRFLAYAADCALLYEQCRSVVGEFDRVRSQTPTEPVRHVALSDSHS